MLDAVANLVTPEYAYAYGRTAKQAGKHHNAALDAFRRHMSNVTFESEESNKCDEMLERLSDALAIDYPLIDKYFELHTVMSVVTNPSELFFSWGYEGIK